MMEELNKRKKQMLTTAIQQRFILSIVHHASIVLGISVLTAKCVKVLLSTSSNCLFLTWADRGHAFHAFF